MVERAWLHFSGIAWTATPVEVLSRGPKRARVRLLHRLRWRRKWAEAGSTRYVPAESLGATPSAGHMVSVGYSTFLDPKSPRARAAVKRWHGEAVK